MTHVLKFIALAILFIFQSLNLTAQEAINISRQGVEYLNFGRGAGAEPLGGRSYYLDINGKIDKYELVSREQINRREEYYRSAEATGVFWLIFEFRNNESICFILSQKEKRKKFVAVDKVVVPNKSEYFDRSQFVSCEFDGSEDEEIFTLYVFDDDRRKNQYYDNIVKAWKADKLKGKILEIDATKVHCLNGYYWSYMHDNETVPKWYYSGIAGVINDPDGYTNVRSRPNLNSRILFKLLDNIEFRYWEDPDYDWWKVHIWTDEMDKPVNGFVHKSRVKKK
jgi:hypothetical protein